MIGSPSAHFLHGVGMLPRSFLPPPPDSLEGVPQSPPLSPHTLKSTSLPSSDFSKNPTASLPVTLRGAGDKEVHDVGYCTY